MVNVQLSAQGSIIKTAYEAQAYAYTDTKNAKLDDYPVLNSNPLHFLNGAGAWATPGAFVCGDLASCNLGHMGDVTLNSPMSGHILRHDGTDFKNVLGTTHFATASHNHDGSYSALGHNHDSAYYTKTLEDAWRNGVTQTEMGYVAGITSDVQTQLDSMLPKDGSEAMVEMLGMGATGKIQASSPAGSSSSMLWLQGGTSINDPTIGLYGKDRGPTDDGQIVFWVPNEIGDGMVTVGGFIGKEATPYFTLNSHQIKGLSAGTAATDAATVAQANTRYIQVEIYDPNTDVAVGTKKAMVHIPFAGTLTGVHARVDTPSSGGTPTFDIEKNGATVFSTLLTIDQSENGSEDAAIPAVISDSAIVENDVYTIDVDVAGTSTKGLVVTCTVVVT